MFKKIIYLFIVVNFFASSFVYAAKGDGNKYSDHLASPDYILSGHSSVWYTSESLDHDVLQTYAFHFLKLLQNDIDEGHLFTSEERTAIKKIYSHILRQKVINGKPIFNMSLDFLVKNKEIFNEANTIEFAYFVWEVLEKEYENDFSNIKHLIKYLKEGSFSKKEMSFYFRQGKYLSLGDMLALTFMNDNVRRTNDFFIELMYDAVSEGDIETLKVITNTIDNAKKLEERDIFKEKLKSANKRHQGHYSQKIGQFFRHKKYWYKLLNMKNYNGDTLVTNVLKSDLKNKTEFLQYIVSKGANPFYADDKDKDPFTMATKSEKALMYFTVTMFNAGETEIAPYGGFVDETINAIVASTENREKIIDKYLLRHNINSKLGGKTLLDKALNIEDAKIRLAVVESLLRRGANPNILDNNNITALQRAVYKRYNGSSGPSYDLILMLLMHGGDLTKENHRGRTALDGLKVYLSRGKYRAKYEEWGALFNNKRSDAAIGVLEFILCKDIVTDVNSSFKSAGSVTRFLEGALRVNNQELRYKIISLLVKHGADVNEILPSGKTALSIAVTKRNRKKDAPDYKLIAKMSHYGDWYKTNRDNRTAKDIFERGESKGSLLDKYLNLEAEFVKQVANGEHSVFSHMFAMKLGFGNAVIELDKKKNTDVEKGSLSLITFDLEVKRLFEKEYIESIKHKKLDKISLYLFEGLEPDYKMENGLRLIEFAAKEGNVDAVKLFLEYGAKRKIKNRKDVIVSLRQKINNKDILGNVAVMERHYEQYLDRFSEKGFTDFKKSVDSVIALIARRIKDNNDLDKYKLLLKLEKEIGRLKSKTSFENDFKKASKEHILRIKNIRRRARAL